jgi:hypothetical protein
MKPSILAILSATSLCAEPYVEAGVVTLSFSATITESEFSTPGYRVGDTLTGALHNDRPHSTAFASSSADFTHYMGFPMRVNLGGTDYGSSFVMDLVHSIGPGDYHGGLFHFDGPVDIFDAYGCDYSEAVEEGFMLYCTIFLMADTDHSVYGLVSPPYPADFPPLDEFEQKEFKMIFLGGPVPLVTSTRYIVTRIDNIEISSDTPTAPDAVPEDARSICLLGASCGLMALSQMSRRRTTPPDACVHFWRY